MNKIILILGLFIFSLNQGFCQRLLPAERKELRQQEDSLKSYAMEMIQGKSAEDRFQADSLFTKGFVRALKVKNSFYYPFDSLVTVSRLSPSDSSFKIFTWQLVLSDDKVRQHGAIQMRTGDGSLKLFPLIDKSELINDLRDTVTDNFNWIGAVYYKIIEKKSFGKKAYTLLGYDEYNLNSNRKIIDVLTFIDGRPGFGGPFFSFPDNGINPQPIARFIMEYKKNASPRLTFDPDMDMIIYEHLISETGEPEKKYTYIPDGDYEGLKWINGKWVHIEKVFTYKTPEGKEPVPQPIRDSKGTIDESKLSQRMPDAVEDSSPHENNASPVKKRKPGKNQD
jgi:hypothetical protein